MVRENHEQNTVRRYLLRQLSAEEQENVEYRLLSDDDFSEELEIVEDELIDEYLAGELSRTERKQFEDAFLASPERRQKLKTAQAVNRYFRRLTPPSTIFQTLRKWLTPFSVPVGVPVTVGVLIVVGVLIWRGGTDQSDLEKGLLALNDAYRQERPVEARVSQLDYAPFITRRGGEPERVNTLERSRAQLLLSEALKKKANAESYHGLGKFYLLQKDPDKAIEYLEQARKANGSNAQIYADLGAAYLERGKRGLEAGSSEPPSGKGLEDLGRSLEYLKQALELKPNLLEALFNRALVHQYQGLNQPAEADWRSYLEKDPNSPWAKEAQQNLKLLEEKKQSSQNTGDSLDLFMRAYRARDDEGAWELYKRRYGSRGNEITNSLVTRILADPETTDNLQALSYLGKLERRKTRDTFTSDLAKFYISATPQTRSLVAQARQQIDEGYKLFRQSKIGDATELFASARQVFEKAGDIPEARAAEAAIAHGAANQPDLPRAKETLSRLIPGTEAKGYKWLLAQCLTRQAHLNANLKNFSKAISAGNRALQLFQETEDVSNVLGGLLQLAGLHLFLNDSSASFSYLQRALVISQQEVIPLTDLWGIRIGVSLNLTALKLHRAALDYQNEALQLAHSLGIPVNISLSYQFIGLSYGFLGQYTSALQSMRQAYDEGKRLSAERTGRNMMASASLKLGDLYRAAGDPAHALTAYDESLQLYETLNFGHYSYAAHKGKFLSYVALRNDAMASQELLTVLSLFDEYRETIVSERQKAFFFDREQDTYDLAIDFVYSRLGDSRRAFEYSEVSRARNLRELMHRGAEVTQTSNGLDVRSSSNNDAEHESLSLAGIQQRLPAEVQVVQYAVLDKKLLAWVVTRDRFFSTAVDVEATKLAQAIATTLKQINERDDNASAASLKNLYHLMIAPIKEHLDPNKVLCVIPDKNLHYVPFGALLSDGSGRYLLQDFRIMVSPSATIFVESTESARGRAQVKDERLLAVGNPAFDRSSNPELANLPEAEREVERLAKSYVLRRVFLKGEATRKSITEEISHADVAHFAAHYEIDQRSSLSSRFILGPEPGDYAHAQPSGLSSADIYQMKLTRTRLVILSGCTTGVEQQFAGEGAIGFARSFLVAGVPVVVASLWPVDSDATAELMIAFHRFRRVEKLSTTEALMRAQQEMITRGNFLSPYYWAGFSVVGGFADF